MKMSYIKQFKIFMWKNWKIFRQRSIAFIIGAEIVVSVVLVFTFDDPRKDIDSPIVRHTHYREPNLVVPFLSSGGKSGNIAADDYFFKKRQYNDDDYFDEETGEYHRQNNGEEYLSTEYDGWTYYEYDYDNDIYEISKEPRMAYEGEQCDSGIIAFILPENQSEMNGDEFISKVMNYTRIAENHDVSSMKFKNEKEMMSYIKNKNNNNTIVASVIFHKDYTDYSIRLDTDTVPDPEYASINNFGRSEFIMDNCVNQFSGVNTSMYDYGLSSYCLTEGQIYQVAFVPLQLAVDSAIIEMKTKGAIKGISISEYRDMPNPKEAIITPDEEEKRNSFQGYAKLLPFIFVAQLFHLSNRIMEEKEKKIKEGLVSIGAHRSLFWITWEIVYIPISFGAIAFTLLLNPSYIFSSIDIFLFVVLMLLYAISIYQLTVILTYFFKKNSTVNIVLIFISLSVYILNNIIFIFKFNGYEMVEKVVSFLFSPSGMGMAASTIFSIHIKLGNDMYIYKSSLFDHSSGWPTITFTNMFESDFGRYFIGIIFDIVLYTVIILIFDFFEGKSFNSVSSKKVKTNTESPYANDIQENPEGSELMVQAKNISKYFKYGNLFGKRRIDNGHEEENSNAKVFAANDNISFNAYKDEIFGILGHNGSGKSTLINNMIGILKPDNGDTYYSGLPISKNKKKIYSSLGMCPQNNILYDGFTPVEHFKIFAGIKGIENNSEEDCHQWLKEIDLFEKKSFNVEELSGGQKRKLCIGLALIGNPKYVFLDEPTTGLDPLSRRKIWSLLLSKKKDRVIFITTHYMDEADIIADRKLILNKGTIRCMGSSIYLKNHFKMKYHLEVESDQSVKSIDNIVKQYIPEAEYYNNKTQITTTPSNGNHRVEKLKDTKEDNNVVIDMNPVNNNEEGKMDCYVWRLPIHSSSSFSSLLKRLNEEKENGYIKAFAINAPMLEELFVNLENENIKVEETSKAIELPNSESIKRPSTLNMALRFIQYRIKLYLRNIMYILMAIVLPFIISFCAFYYFNYSITHNFSQSSVSKDVSKKIELSTDLYKGQQWNYDNGHSSLNKTDSVIDEFFPILTHFNRNDLALTGRTISSDPYYVASFFGKEFEDHRYYYNVYYNSSITHSLPVTVNALSNSILKANGVNETIHVANEPFYPVDMDVNEILSDRFLVVFVLLICLGFALSFYGTEVVHERTKGLFKQLQLNGVSNLSYWLSVFISDYLLYVVTIIIVIVAAIVIGFIPFKSIILVAMVFISFLICGIACLLFNYCFSFFFERENKSYIVFVTINVFVTTLILMYFFVKGFDFDIQGIPQLTTMMVIMETAFNVLFPNVCISRILKNVINIGIKHKYYDYSISLGNIFSFSNLITPELLATIVSTLLYAFMLYRLDKKYNKPNNKTVYKLKDEIKEKFMTELEEGDDDVRREHERVVADREANLLPLKLEHLTKEYERLKFKNGVEMHDAIKRKNAKYGEFHVSEFGSRRVISDAYRNVSLGIDKCECFGILGPNGSGKSSMLNTVGLAFQQTLGKLYFDGKDTTERKSNAIPIGYCPQEDTLWDQMTLYEHIEMYLYLQGYSKSESKRLALEYIDYCRLGPHKNKFPSQLSGGTSRKLSILIALCCSTTKILLDEPTAGMDPSTRRYVWDMIKATIQDRQSSTIMSTHSMEEAELLCNRIGIIVNGKLRCIGSPEHLKMKFGNTYILDVQTDNVDDFHQSVVIDKDLFAGDEYVRENKSLQRVKYEITNSNETNISRVFDIMESSRQSGLFSDYSYSRTSLEQIFLNFAQLKESVDLIKEQEDEKEEESSIEIKDDGTDALVNKVNKEE